MSFAHYTFFPMPSQMSGYQGHLEHASGQQHEVSMNLINLGEMWGMHRCILPIQVP